MGFIFGGIGIGGDGAPNYTIGWVDDDTSKGYLTIPGYPEDRKVDYPILNMTHDVIDDIDDFNLINYTSKEKAEAAAFNETIIAYVYFPEGYEKSISEVWAGDREKPLNYSIYFLQSISPQTKSVISQLISSILGAIVNYKPDYMNITYEQESIVGHEVNQITFQAPGLILYGPMTILSFAIIVITSEKKDGIYKRLASSEVKNHEIILSSIVVNVTLIFMQFVVGGTILLIFGWEPIMASLFDAILGLILTILAFSFFILALAFALAPVFKDPENAGGGVWIILIPLMMLSGIFVPLEIMGEGMQDIAKLFPTRYAVLLLNDLLLNGQPLNNPDILLNLGVLCIYSLVIFIIGVLAFSKFKQ